MRLSLYRLFITFIIIFPCFLGKGNQSFSDTDTLSLEVLDTSIILKDNWEKIKKYDLQRDTVIIQQTLEKYQKLAHQYGFRFEEQFPNQKLRFKYRQLFDELYILEDTAGHLNIEEIIQPAYQVQFQPNYSSDELQRDVVNFFPLPTSFNPKSTYWVKLNVINPNLKHAIAWLMIGWNERSWENIEVFRYDGKQIEKIGRSGLRLPLEEKMEKDWRNFVSIEVPANSQYTYYFKLDGLFYPKYAERIDFYHFDKKTYWNQKSIAFLNNGVFLGMTFLLILLVAIIYAYSKEKDTLFFLIYLIGIWLSDFADTENFGASNLYKEFFPIALEGGDIIAIAGFIMKTLGFAFFPITFLEAETYAPKLKKWILRIFYFEIFSYLFLSCFNLFLYPYFDYPYHWVSTSIYLFLPISTLPLILIVILGIIAIKRQHPLSKLFMIAYCPAIIFLFLVFGTEILFGSTFSTNQYHNGTRITYLATYILFTVAIVYKRQMERNAIMAKRLKLDQQLYQEQQEAKRLKELDTFKSRLFTNLTHEFRTPLTVILGMAKNILDTSQQKFKKEAQLIQQNGQNLLRLVNQLLDLSKLENRSFKLNQVQRDIIPYLRYVSESFHSHANSQNLSLIFFTSIKELTMDFDPEQLKQVMTNLISNAIKFTSSGGDINIEVTQEEAQLIIKVSDTGIGISKGDLPHIFDRFYQVDGSTTRAGEGTGIGLAHTQELVKLMKGKIEVESELGQGTRFLVYLPIVWSKNDGIKVMNDEYKLIPQELFSAKTSKDENSSFIAHHSSLPQVLIIEDNPDVVTYLKSCLKDQYELQVAYNGRIGIELALENIPDLIISDVMMPEKDGYEVCATLKNDERTSHIPIILLTAKADADSRIVGLKKGADVYLSKPFDKDELLVRLKQLNLLRQRLMEKYSSFSLASFQPPKSTSNPEDIFFQKLLQIIEDNYTDDRFSLAELCQKVGMSRSQLFRKMKALVDVSPSVFLRDFRLGKAKQLLETASVSVSEAAYQTGFKDPSYFSKLFKQKFGMQPNYLRK